MALYENGKRISGIRDFPAYTWAEYHALPVAQRPKVWKCTDRDYTEIPPEKVSVTADGVKTYAQLLGTLRTLVDSSKVTIQSVFEEIGATYKKYYYLTAISGTQVIFARNTVSLTAIYNEIVSIDNGSGTYFRAEGSSIYNNSSSIPASGVILNIYY